MSAGAVMTPQVLSRSGIGPRGEVSNLEGVGRNLQDHPAVGVVLRWGDDEKDGENDEQNDEQNFEIYLEKVEAVRRGIEKKPNNSKMATPGFRAGAFFSSPFNSNR